jgi:hypothetical protein
MQSILCICCLIAYNPREFLSTLFIYPLGLNIKKKILQTLELRKWP